MVLKEVQELFSWPLAIKNAKLRANTEATDKQRGMRDAQRLLTTENILPREADRF
jgi:hypothetical protein